MADRVRLQAITENNPETWADVGPDGINLPVDVKDSVLPDGASTSENQTNGSQKTQVVEKEPTDSTKLNGSVAITEVIVGTVTTKTIVKTIGTDTYTKTVATDSSDNSVIISSWA